MLHGIAAYSKERGIHALLRRVDAISGGAEICTANVPIGNIGVFVSGRITGAFPRDVWSGLDNDGNRYTTFVDEEQEHFLNDTWAYINREARGFEAVSEDWIVDVLKAHKERGSRYAEFWERDCKVMYVWTKKQASDYVKTAARIIARKYHCGVFELPEDYDTSELWGVSDAPAEDTPENIDFLEAELNGF